MVVLIENREEEESNTGEKFVVIPLEVLGQTDFVGLELAISVQFGAIEKERDMRDTKKSKQRVKWKRIERK